MIEILEKAGVPLFRTPLSSKAFTTEVTVLLEEKFAPRTSLHGTLLEIRGLEPLFVVQVVLVKVKLPLP